MMTPALAYALRHALEAAASHLARAGAGLAVQPAADQAPPTPENRPDPERGGLAHNRPEFPDGIFRAENLAAPNPGHGARAAVGAARNAGDADPGARGAANPVRGDGGGSRFCGGCRCWLQGGITEFGICDNTWSDKYERETHAAETCGDWESAAAKDQRPTCGNCGDDLSQEELAKDCCYTCGRGGGKASSC